MQSIFILWKLFLSLLTLTIEGGSFSTGGIDSSYDDGLNSDGSIGGFGNTDDYDSDGDGINDNNDYHDGDGSDYDWDDDGISGVSDDDEDNNDSWTDTISSLFSDEEEIQNTVTGSETIDGTTYTTTVDINTGDYSYTAIDENGSVEAQTGLTDSYFDEFTVSEYTSTDGIMDTSYHTTYDNDTGFSYSYDQHYHTQTNTPYGTTAELYADISETIGYAPNESVAQGLEVVGTMINIALISLPTLVIGSQLISAGKALGSTTATVLGYATIGTGAYSTYSELSELSALFGSSTSLSVSLATSTNIDNAKYENIISDAIEEEIETKEANDMFYADIATGTIFDKLAGGRVYQGIFAGGNFFDATKGSNTNFSVGEKYSMSPFLTRIKAPYSFSLPKNQAGTSAFSVV